MTKRLSILIHKIEVFGFAQCVELTFNQQSNNLDIIARYQQEIVMNSVINTKMFDIFLEEIEKECKRLNSNLSITKKTL